MVLQWLLKQTANFYDDGIQMFVVQYEYRNIDGSYGEKLMKVWGYI